MFAGLSPLAVAMRATPSAFTPSRLFTVAATGGWWDVSDLSSLSQDDAGTVPAAIDAVVGRVFDKSGNGNHLLQATAGSKPILRQAPSGALYLEFDGVDDYLTAAFTFVQPIDRVSALRQISYTDNDRIFGSGSVGGGAQVFQFGTPTVYLFSGSPVGNANAPLTASFVLTERHNGASSRIAVNDLAYATGDGGVISGGGVTVGANQGGANPSNIRFYGAVALGREMTDAEIADARAYFGAKYAGLELGTERTVDGAFDNDIAPDWSGSGWTINANRARAITGGAASNFTNDTGTAAEAGKSYFCAYKVPVYTQGGVQIGYGGALGTLRTAVGVYSEVLVAVDTGGPLLRAAANTSLFCDDVSIREVI